MATGTGKTRTVLGMIYRFLDAGRFKRILYLVDRTSLGDQTMDTFKEVKLKELLTLNQMYDVKSLEDKEFEKDTRVHIATVQSLVKRIMYNESDKSLGVSDYDMVIVDEAHRGYILDNFISEAEENNSLISVLPQEIIESAKSFSYKDSTLEREISNLTTQLDAIKKNDDDNDEQHKESATERIRFLEKKIDEMKNERKGADRILSTYDHRPLLLDALDNAQNMVVIVSPWIKSGGMNNEILGRIERALQRGTIRTYIQDIICTCITDVHGYKHARLVH